jgi:hypothetical protein
MFRRLYDWQTRAEMRSGIAEVWVVCEFDIGLHPSPDLRGEGGAKRRVGDSSRGMK